MIIETVSYIGYFKSKISRSISKRSLKSTNVAKMSTKTFKNEMSTSKEVNVAANVPISNRYELLSHINFVYLSGR